jgi:alpha-amylase
MPKASTASSGVSTQPLPSLSRSRQRSRTALLSAAAVLAAGVVPVTLDAAGSSPARAATALSKDVTANLFEWNWNSVASECTNVLGPDGYAAVQVAPPQDSLDSATHAWWDVYQPVDYSLTSRMGTQAQFRAMVAACHAAGVKVYADVVLNHMAAQPTGGTGTSYGGASYTPSSLSYPDYSAADFHNYPSDCPESSDSIVNWDSYTEVTRCRLDGLPDLRTESTVVRTTEAAYLNTLIADGVDGFRLDSAKHLGESDIAAIEALLNKDSTTGAAVYITQEVYPGDSTEDTALQPASFEPEGSLLGFDYAYALYADFTGSGISNLSSFTGMVPSTYASTFVANHDTERAGTTLSYQSGAAYTLATEFLLAYGYGTPQVYSSFDWSAYDQGPPSDGNGFVTDTTCASGWECTDRVGAIARLVPWHNLAYTNNDAVANWYSDGSNLIAFSRGADAWIAINNEPAAKTATFTTGLPDGTYCDLIHSTYSSGSCSGAGITVSGGAATVTVPAHDSIAFDVNTLISTSSASSAAATVSVTFDEYKTTVWGQNVYLVGSTSQLGSWAPANALLLSSSTYPTWSLTLNMTSSTYFEYKFIVKDGSGNVTWESGANRTYTTPASGSATISDTWK